MRSSAGNRMSLSSHGVLFENLQAVNERYCCMTVTEQVMSWSSLKGLCKLALQACFCFSYQASGQFVLNK